MTTGLIKTRKFITMTRAVQGSSKVSFGPNPNLTHQHRVGGGGTRNRLPASIGQIDFVFKSVWSVERVTKAANVTEIFKKFTGIYKNSLDLHWKSPKSAWIWPNLAKSYQKWSRSRRIWAWSCRSWPDLYITSVGSSGSGFGEENPPLDSPTSSLGYRNLSPTDESVSSDWNWVGIVRIGQSGGSGLGLDTPNYDYFLKEIR